MTAGRWDATEWRGKCMPCPLPAACGLIWNNICEGTRDISIQQRIWWAKVSVIKFLVQGNQDIAAFASACLYSYHPTLPSSLRKGGRRESARYGKQHCIAFSQIRIPRAAMVSSFGGKSWNPLRISRRLPTKCSSLCNPNSKKDSIQKVIFCN